MGGYRLAVWNCQRKKCDDTRRAHRLAGTSSRTRHDAGRNFAKIRLSVEKRSPKSEGAIQRSPAKVTRLVEWPKKMSDILPQIET